jgi:hypothetical protein
MLQNSGEAANPKLLLAIPFANNQLSGASEIG